MAPGEVAEHEDPPRFDALSLLDPVKGEEETEHVATEQILQELQDPVTEQAVGAEASLEEHPDLAEVENCEVDNQENNPGASEPLEHHPESLEPIVDSSPTVGLREESDFEREAESAPAANSKGFASVEPSASNLAAARAAPPVYVQFLHQAGGEEEEPAPLLPTSAFRKEQPKALQQVGTSVRATLRHLLHDLQGREYRVLGGANTREPDSSSEIGKRISMCFPGGCTGK